jgi:hypothetical protein
MLRVFYFSVPKQEDKDFNLLYLFLFTLQKVS